MSQQSHYCKVKKKTLYPPGTAACGQNSPNLKSPNYMEGPGGRFPRQKRATHEIRARHINKKYPRVKSPLSHPCWHVASGVRLTMGRGVVKMDRFLFRIDIIYIQEKKQLNFGKLNF